MEMEFAQAPIRIDTLIEILIAKFIYSVLAIFRFNNNNCAHRHPVFDSRKLY